MPATRRSSQLDLIAQTTPAKKPKIGVKRTDEADSKANTPLKVDAAAVDTATETKRAFANSKGNATKRSSRRLSTLVKTKPDPSADSEANVKINTATQDIDVETGEAVLEVPSGSESPDVHEDDVSHYEKLRQDNMRRNNEILEVWIHSGATTV
jgi:hypothetical protein